MAIEFYKASSYWNPLYDEINDSSLAYRLFDLGVNAGVSKAVRILQLTIKKYYDNDIKVDGIFGNQTLLMVNRFANYSAIPIRLHKIKTIPGENVFYAYYIHEIGKFYHSLSNFWKFGKGWLNRVRKVFNGAPDLYKITKIK
jgi:lysozyme family protein